MKFFWGFGKNSVKFFFSSWNVRILFFSLLACVDTPRVLPVLLFLSTRAYVCWGLPLGVAPRSHIVLTLLSSETHLGLIFIKVVFVVNLWVATCGRLFIETKIARYPSLRATICRRIVLKLNVSFFLRLIHSLLTIDIRKLNVTPHLISQDKLRDLPVSFALIPNRLLFDLVKVRVLKHHVDDCVAEF